METIVAHVLSADHVQEFTHLNVAYPADDFDADLKPTPAELKGFEDPGAALAEAVFYYRHNVKRYLGSINEGIASTIAEAMYVHQRCPQALLILAGYSQGAMVMHQAELQLAADQDTGVLAQIAGTLLLGDGDRVSNTTAREFGTSRTRSKGIRTYLLANSGKDVLDPATTANICNAGDIVCDFGTNTVIHWRNGIEVHESYLKASSGPGLADAAAWIGQLAANRLVGTLWTATEAPLPAGAATQPRVHISSIACASASRCVAAGTYIDSAGDVQGLLLTRSGTSWVAATAPLPAGANADPGVDLTSVACPAVSSCVAVGFYADSSRNAQGLLLTGSGTSWTATEAPLPSESSAGSLAAIGCASAASCVAAGQYSGPQSLVLTGSRTNWTPRAAPLPAGASTDPDATLQDVTCPSASSCVAVGSYVATSGGSGLVLTGSGTKWTATKAPLPDGPADLGAYLLAGACASVSSCALTGAYLDSEDQWHGLVLTGSGTKWKATETPVPADGDYAQPTLNSVSCPTASSCVVSGYYNSSTGSQGLLLTGSGTKWTATEAPLPAGGGPNDYLLSVACPSASACAAVGDYDDADGSQGLLLTGSGTAWTATETPLPLGAATIQQGASVEAVACPSVTACVAAGFYSDASGNFQGLLLTGPG
jgi:hypothetical protein